MRDSNTVKRIIPYFLVPLLTAFLASAHATTYTCVEPEMIQARENPTTGKIDWYFQFPLASKWEGFQTEPTKKTGTILKPGAVRAIRLDYGPDGQSWPIPRLTCFYLGDGNTTASGFISTRFFIRPTTVPSIDKIDYSETVYCDSTEPQKCQVVVD